MNIRNQKRFEEALEVLEALGVYDEGINDSLLEALDLVVTGFFRPPGQYKSWRAWRIRCDRRFAPGTIIDWLEFNPDHFQREGIEHDLDEAVAGCESQQALINLIRAIHAIADVLGYSEFNTWAGSPTARLMALELNISELEFVCEHGVDPENGESPIVEATCELLRRGYYPGQLAVTGSLFLTEMGELQESLACDWEHIFKGCGQQERAEILERIQRELRHHPRSPTLRAMRDELEDI